jgi:hypothetical protein
MRRPVILSFLPIALVACGGADRNPVEPVATPAPAPVAAPLPSPVPTPQDTPAALEGNRPPRVTLSFDGPSSCHPRQPEVGDVVPCTVLLVADAKDPDGDPITLSWIGCARGGQARAACTVRAPGPVVATVEVLDSRGASTRASLTAHGDNGAPYAVLNPHPPFSAGHLVGIYGYIRDPDDGGVCGRRWCVRAEASGACGPGAYLDCTCLGELYAELTPRAAGTCTVTVLLQDDWGLAGRSSVTFEVQGP